MKITVFLGSLVLAFQVDAASMMPKPTPGQVLFRFIYITIERVSSPIERHKATQHAGTECGRIFI